MKRSMYVILFVIVVLLLLKVKLGAEINYEILIDFEQFPLSSERKLTRNVFNELGYETSNWDNNLASHGTIEEVDGNKYLSIFSPNGSYGTKTSGLQTEIKLKPGNEYYMSYDFMFDENFSFGSEYRGGKLPGITAGNRCSGECDGKDGFAARFMWRRNGEGELYLCYLDQTSEYCDDFYFKDPVTNKRFQFKREQMYNIEEYVRLNTGPNNYDGQITVAIDGVTVLNVEDIRLVTNNDKIDTFYLSMFYGGSTEKWRASSDSSYYIDNIYLQRLS